MVPNVLQNPCARQETCWTLCTVNALEGTLPRPTRSGCLRPWAWEIRCDIDRRRGPPRTWWTRPPRAPPLVAKTLVPVDDAEPSETLTAFQEKLHDNYRRRHGVGVIPPPPPQEASVLQQRFETSSYTTPLLSFYS